MMKVTDMIKGFLTTFTLLARDHFTLADMIWILIKVFFGSSYLGFVSRPRMLIDAVLMLNRT
jgi:hypothetical protein